MAAKAALAVFVAGVMVLSALLAIGSVAIGPTASTAGSTSAVTAASESPALAGAGSGATQAATVSPAPAAPSAPSSANTPVCAAAALSPTTLAANAAQAHFDDIAANATAHGYPAGALHPPVAQGASNPAGCQENNESDPAPAPSGVTYNGQTDISGVGTKDMTLDSNSVEGILTVSSTQNLYPDSTAPTLWGDQLNVVLTNVTLLGQKCPKTPCSATGSGSYSFWVQSLAEYNVTNQTLWFYDATWNFTSGSADMFSSSLVSWSPWSGNYTGVWLLANTPYIHAPLPYTLSLYVNSSVTAAGDQELWYNYSVLSGGHFYGNGNYDYLIFKSQAPGPVQPLAPAPFEASETTSHTVHEGYEFDVMIGADDGTNQLILNASATEQVKYCSIADCTPTNFVYSNVPAAVNYGSQTGETTVGMNINYVGQTALISGGPFIERGLWNYTGQTGANVGQVRVNNAISVSGSPLALSAQPYFFVFFENTNYSSQGYQWASDQSAWYLNPGVYNYEIMLADYQEQTGTFAVSSTPVTLTAVLPYATTSGVYTPLWAFNNAQLAGISTSGAGTVGSQYVLFNNPTSSCTFCGSAANANLSSVFYLPNDYHFTTFAGIILDGTSAYVTINSPPTFCVHASGSTYYFLAMWFYNTTHMTLEHATGIRGWPVQEEWDFYLVVPASQNIFPQGDVDILDSTGDLVMSNTFIAIKPSSSSYVSPDQIVLGGGRGNVVWGNTFRDPPGVTLGTTYAGIGEDEGGDLIYNNNFTIDNPVVRLPFNMPNTGECLPQCSAPLTNAFFWNLGTNSWNITPQPSSNVALTVNGFPLSGNVLGAGVTTQGGNYYWNYGTSPNNRSTNPYTSRFLYTDWSNLYPLGCPSVQAVGAPCGTAPPIVGSYQNGMPSGSGDYAPYGPTVTFTETGLGGAWAVTLNGKLYDTTSSTLSVPVAYGTYSYVVSSLTPGYTATPTTGSVTANGVPTVHVAFSTTPAPTYTLYFTESGLPVGTSWSVTVGAGGPTTGTTSTLSVSGEPAGPYTYTISGPAGYTASPASGSVTVTSASVSTGITFSLITYTVTYTESGLPGGTLWALSFGGVIHASTGTTVSFQVPAGTYAWLIGAVAGYTVTYESTTSPTTVSGPTAITITFSA